MTALALIPLFSVLWMLLAPRRQAFIRGQL